MGLNWRKPFLQMGLRLTRNSVLKELELLRSIEFASPAELGALHEQRLRDLLLHAFRNTAYYREVLGDLGVVKDDVVFLDRFEHIPILTKKIIREETGRLRAERLPRGRKPYPNSTGGSTGQPLQFWQDSIYDSVNMATKLFHFEMFGKELGELELKVWGSETDLFKGTIGAKAKLENFAYNRIFQQCFHLPEDRIRTAIRKINEERPKIIWTYRDGMRAIADHVVRNSLEVHRPAAIFVSGGTLYQPIRETISKAFSAPVVNFYGSREMGDVACQCSEERGLHISTHSHRVEVVDGSGTPVSGEGDLVITSLANYAMPFIRYEIGDRGSLGTGPCACGRPFPVLEEVSGRIMEMFVNARGEYVDTSYFIHLIGVVHNSGDIDQFQVVQEEPARIRVKLILKEGATRDAIRPQLDRISDRVKFVMGEDCEVLFDFVKEIPLTKSGKYIYMMREFSMDDDRMPRPEELDGASTL